MKTYRPWAPDRTYLLPPSTLEWLPDDHLARFVLDIVDELDLSAIDAVLQAKDPRGERPYAPQMMVALLLYGYSVGVFSSRRLARATWTDLGARVIAAEEHPHFTTVNQFRLDHQEALASLFTQVLTMCQRAGMVELGHVAIDGTKIQANASKHKAMSYDRMKETEQRLAAEAKAMLAKADAADAAEDAEFGADNDGTNIPEELRRRDTRRARIREAREALEREAAEGRRLELEEKARELREAASSEASDRKSAKLTRRADTSDNKAKQIPQGETAVIPGSQDGLPFHVVPHDAQGNPTPKAQRNFTDPESRIQKGNGGYLQGYNCQAAVDQANGVIVAQVLTNQPPDTEHLEPLVEQIHANLDAFPDKATADAGYYSDRNSQYLQNKGIDAYISTRRRKHDEGIDDAPTPTAPQARTADGAAMAAKLNTPEGREIYSRRKWTVEPVFGEIKEARGFRRFRLRGLRKVRVEWSLLCTTHNLLKLKKYRTK